MFVRAELKNYWSDWENSKQFWNQRIKERVPFLSGGLVGLVFGWCRGLG
jgi:hypothetical protein